MYFLPLKLFMAATTVSIFMVVVLLDISESEDKKREEANKRWFLAWFSLCCLCVWFLVAAAKVLLLDFFVLTYLLV